MLGRRQESARLLVVGSYRPVDAIVARHPLRALIQELRVRRECEDIALAFLREPHVAAYLAQRFGGHAFPSELARAVHQRTDGNPLFMVRVVDELVALRVLEREDDRWRLRGSVGEIARAVPDSLRALVEKQIDRLQPEAQRLLEVASVLGPEFTIGSVAAGLDLDPLMIEDRCDELVRQGQFLSAGALYVRPDGTHVARYRFTHSLYPHAIAERVPAGLRLRLHQRVGEWLERTYGARVTAIAGPLAWHFEEAGDYRRAIRYLVIAAENAAKRFAYGDASRVLEHARSLLHHLAADARSALEVELLQRIGDAHYGRGAWVECAEAYEAAAARAADAGSTSTQVHALRGLDPSLRRSRSGPRNRSNRAGRSPQRHPGRSAAARAHRAAGCRHQTHVRHVANGGLGEVRGRQRDDPPPERCRPTRVRQGDLRTSPGPAGRVRESAREPRSGIPKEDESTSIMVPMFALSGKMLALLYAGRLGELVQTAARRKGYRRGERQ